MPWRKRFLVMAAAAFALALLGVGTAAVVRGYVVPGTVVIVGTCSAIAMALQAFWAQFDLFRTSFRSGRREAREVALTFDDGPGPDTPAVLDALDAAGVRATFFMLGSAAEARPDLVREVGRRGHLVALHGYSHEKLHLALPGTVERELDRCRQAIQSAGVEPARFFRAPHGFKGPILSRVLRQRGFTLVGWTRGVWDTDRPGVEIITARACEGMRGGEILLFHDGCGTPGMDARRDQTAAAIVPIVRRWRDAGFEFTTIDRMMTASARAVPGAARAARAWGRVAGEGEPEIETGRVTGRLRGAVRWAAVAALIVFSVAAARSLDPNELRRALVEANPVLLVAAAIANLVALVMQTGRWLAIVYPVEPRAKTSDAFFSLVAGYAIGLVVPARASDLARAHLMARRSGASMATLTATVVVDHLLGSVALFGVLGLFAAVSSLPVWLRSAGTVACAAAAAALIALWFLRPRQPLSPGKGLGGIIARLRQGLVAVGRPRALAISWLFAFGGWTSEMVIAHFSLRAFGLPAGIEPSLLVVLATTLSAAASVSPGNAGAFEIACVVALSTFGVAREPALAFAFGYHAVHLIPTAIVGGGWLLAQGHKAGILREVP